MAGTDSSLASSGTPAVDPQACNALTLSPAGLLVPRTVPSGIAPGGNVGASRSVDIDVTDTGGKDCPDTWQVGARLTPVNGEISGAQISPPLTGQWVATGAAAVLPEPGVYEVTATGRGQVCVMVAPNVNAWVSLGLQIDGQGLIGFDVLCQAQYALNAGQSMQTCHSGQGAITRRVQTTGGIVVRTVGALSGNIAGGTLQDATINNPYLFFHKISD
ncbi:hypothetical protein [Streptomyces sp. NPDC056291]|uniref:hypothetical protein n=1 Tax=Streptomyces sp. NPDC056291 TaxID=3345772 RepID=UPI0035DC4DF6